MKNDFTKQDKEKLSNRIVLLSSFIILYALLLMFFRRMCSFSSTVLGAITFMDFLKWISLAGAMVCAAWSAYKDRKGYYLYSGMFLFVFLSMQIIRSPLQDNRAYMIAYLGLLIAFVLTQVYYALKIRRKYEGGWKIAFLSVTFVSIAILVVAAAEPRFWEILPF